MRTHVPTLVLASAVSLLTITSAAAHHPGGVGNSNATGPINTLSATTPEAGDVSVGVSYEITSFDALSDDVLESEGERAAGAGHAHVHSLDDLQMTAFDVAYGVTDNLMVSLRVPYLTREGVRTGHFHHGEPEVENEGGGSGLGDISALLQWRFYRGENVDSSLFGGVKAPTGEDGVRNNFGEAFATEFQPSADAWDWSAGAAATRRIGHLSLDASGLYTFAGENDEDDDLGDRFMYGLAASYRVVGHPTHHHHLGLGAHDHGVGVDLVLELNGEWHREQKEGGETDPNSGGHVLFVAPGVRLVHENWAGHLSVGAPIVRELNGVQAEPGVRAIAGVSRRF
jgi:hypothetical protein